VLSRCTFTTGCTSVPVISVLSYTKLSNTDHANRCPTARLGQLEQAGQLRIPFTTGVLLGIGESEGDTEQSIRAIADIATRYGHIQVHSVSISLSLSHSVTQRMQTAVTVASLSVTVTVN
jgi:2-iminoacetate synthase ThiH